MLSLLKIRNLALVDQLEWEPGKGLVGVTGETGAGKSVIVGALKLVLGERADKGLIRTGEESCKVEAVFALPEPKLVNAILEDAGLDPCDGNELIIRRIISTSSNKQFVNDGAATLALLKKIGSHLVDLHGPHDHQSLLSVERQMAMLDAYAGATAERETYRQKWTAWREASDELEAARHAGEVSDQEKELLSFQVEEIDSASLTEAEEVELEDRYRRTSNATRLSELASQACGAIDQEVLNGLGELHRTLADLHRIDPGVGEMTESLDSATLELRELETSLRDYLAEVQVNPEEAREVEERFNLVESLKRKYGPQVADVLAHGEEARARLSNSENREELLARLDEEVKKCTRSLRSAGKKLGGKREKSASKLALEIRTHLADLGFKQAEFEVELSPRDEPATQGLEEVEFLFGPNPGEPLKPLRQVASSGEVSRVMLAVKNALAEQDATPLMVFDEIDANVGGEIARAVGEKMASLGQEHQVVAITHFPQVAAVAARHFLVIKSVEGGRSLSTLREVEGESRIDELVRMLGGGGKQAREMAKSLLP